MQKPKQKDRNNEVIIVVGEEKYKFKQDNQYVQQSSMIMKEVCRQMICQKTVIRVESQNERSSQLYMEFMANGQFNNYFSKQTNIDVDMEFYYDFIRIHEQLQIDEILVNFLKQILIPNINQYTSCYFTNFGFQMLKKNKREFKTEYQFILNHSIDVCSKYIFQILNQDFVYRQFKNNNASIQDEIIERALKRQYFLMNTNELGQIIDELLIIRDLRSYESLLQNQKQKILLQDIQKNKKLKKFSWTLKKRDMTNDISKHMFTFQKLQWEFNILKFNDKYQVIIRVEENSRFINLLKQIQQYLMFSVYYNLSINSISQSQLIQLHNFKFQVQSNQNCQNQIHFELNMNIQNQLRNCESIQMDLKIDADFLYSSVQQMIRKSERNRWDGFHRNNSLLRSSNLQNMSSINNMLLNSFSSQNGVSNGRQEASSVRNSCQNQQLFFNIFNSKTSSNNQVRN